MPSDQPQPSHDYFHGLLNLEQQKRRAKDLLRDARAGNEAAGKRIHAHLTTPPQKAGDLKLADAQLAIARDAGFASWPKLKAHCDALALRRKLAEQGTLKRPDTADTLHIRCGSDIQHALSLAGFEGAFFEFADPFCQGPVQDLPLEGFVESRAAFVASAYGMAPADALSRMRKEYAALADIHSYSQVVLWFEHDSYDQLILAFLLSYFASHTQPANLELICVDSVPGVPGFTGLGQLAPEILLWLWDNRRAAVTPQQLSLGQRAWAALCAPDPSELHSCATDAPCAVPPMSTALLRHLRELPMRTSGLSYTQHLVLQILEDHGPLKGADLFRKLMTDYEPLPYLGDMMFWHLLVDFLNSDEQPFDYTTHDTANVKLPWPQRVLSINNYGINLLKGRADYLTSYRGQRWVGGVRIDGGQATQKPQGPVYRWDNSDAGYLTLVER